jgi:hypothetical protein
MFLQTVLRSDVCSQSYGAPKSRESHLARFRDLHSGIPGKKNYLDVSSVASHRIYYKGEGGGFLQVWAVVSLVCPCCPWPVLAPRVFQLCINHFVWVVCRPMWVSEAFQLFLIASRSSNTPFYPSKCCELRSVPRLLPLMLSSTWIHIWVLLGVGSASPSPSVIGYHSWNIWPSIGPPSPSSLLVPYPTIFPYHHVFLAYLGPTCICSDLYLHYLGWHVISRWPHSWIHLFGMEGLHLPCTPPSS